MKTTFCKEEEKNIKVKSLINSFTKIYYLWMILIYIGFHFHMNINTGSLYYLFTTPPPPPRYYSFVMQPH